MTIWETFRFLARYPAMWKLMRKLAPFTRGIDHEAMT